MLEPSHATHVFTRGYSDVRSRQLSRVGGAFQCVTTAGSSACSCKKIFLLFFLFLTGFEETSEEARSRSFGFLYFLQAKDIVNIYIALVLRDRGYCWTAAHEAVHQNTRNKYLYYSYTCADITSTYTPKHTHNGKTVLNLQI